ncbi:MAG TPA: hypothetical protein VMV09_00245 [Candidatus Saccharimonadales bacterium]|nr:hypothetical protein [Candidatus Saccharimonadales bacterium]
MARKATFRILGFVVWGCFGAAGGFMAVELVGWVLDPVVVILLWRIYRGWSNRDQFLAVYAIGYLAVTAHYLVPHLYAAWPSLADRIYFGVLLLVGVVLLIASTWHAAAARHRRRGAPTLA